MCYLPSKQLYLRSHCSEATIYTSFSTQSLWDTVMSTRGNARRKDFQTLRGELLRANSLFVDPDFPPEFKSLTYKGNLPSGIGQVVWKRPTDIAAIPQFIVKGASRFDLDQGALGNCWFIAGAAVVATNKKLLSRVVPDDQDFGEGYAGIFHFNFWWYGRWVEVIVDDYLPTDGYRLIYGKNREQPNEFWASLLEKAYAKLKGCYEALDGGKLSESIVDLTGSISENLNLREKSSLPTNLYDILWKCYKMNSMIGGAINLPKHLRDNSNVTSREVERPNGLYMGHAYSVTGLSVVPLRDAPVQLIRLRNPWGRGEWKGAWSDRSEEIKNMSPEVRQRLGIVIREDGEFWMSFHDLLNQFDELSLCHLHPDALTLEIANDERRQGWKVVVYHDAWIKGVTAGGCGNDPYQDLYWKNPQFFVTLKDPDESDNIDVCTIIVSLVEKEKNNKSQIAIGFSIYKLKNPQSRPLDTESAARNSLRLEKSSGSYSFGREKTLRFELKPGTYVIIPSTFYPNEEAEFMLRVYTEKSVQESGVLDENSGPVNPPSSPVDPIKDLYKKHAGEDGKIHAAELKKFLYDLSVHEFKDPLKFSTETCRSLVTMMDRNRSGALDFDESVKAWKEVKAYKTVFETFDKDQSGKIDTFELGKVFSTLGFPVSRMVMTSIVRRYGDKNNRISLYNFIIVIAKLTLMYSVFKDQQLKTNDKETAAFTMNEFLYYVMYC